MIHFSDLHLTLNNLEYTTIKTNKKVEYINLACGFDIETTSVYVGETKAAFSYVWMISAGVNSPVYYGRTWEDFITVCSELQHTYNLSTNRRLVVYVHNLGYEFQFMHKYFNWLEVFAIAERKPIKAFCDFGIEFRDSYILSGYSLANTAKNMTKHNIKKLEGDLDYKLIRHEETELSDDEKAYCENDVKIITAYIDEQIDLYGDVSKIPMTNTGRVRKHVKDECYYTSKNHRKSSKSKYFKYRQVMQDLTLEPETYIQLKRAFMGGFTHANAEYSGKTLEDVSSIDFTSSYPSVMCAEKFPMSRFKSVQVQNLDHLKELCSTYAVVFDVTFEGIKSKIKHENYLSESKCFSVVKPNINNGRISSAESLGITLTDVDYDIVEQAYSWVSISVANVKYAHKNYLPKAIIKSILELYQGKTTLKDVEGSEVEYLLSKGMLNSIYGMCVTDIVKDNSIYNEGWEVEKVDIETEVEKYNAAKGRFLYYPWGLWVTAYARRNLWTGIIAVGDDYVYSDTDSLKLLNYDKHVDYIEWFNTDIVNKMLTMCDYYKFDTELLSPKTKKGKVKTLGIWDFEGCYPKFKTLGAKRYLVFDGENLHITVAGLSKQNGISYMREKCNNDIDEVFDMFNDALYIPANRTGKMTHTYIDDELKFKIIDFNGVESTVNPLSGVHLGDCDFTLSIADHYKHFLNNLSKGYIFKGVKHV